ncbi:MAG: HAD family hydrolase [Butyrivibrio sp.]|nr:HAD family hydrolase [Butyrivibrio sp.]
MGFDDFKKKKDFVVCIDSDGCAMDTMNIKHIRCFGPCMVKEWKLDQWKDEILFRWNEINLYTMTRGINRFKALAQTLLEIDEKYTRIDGIDALMTWVKDAPELSNAAIEKMLSVNPIFEKALSWSRRVNEEIEKLPKDKIVPFEGVKEAFEKIHESCDIAVVSSANPEAVRQEWERFGLLEMTDIVCTQDMGSKAFCIGEILKKGYNENKVLMCGDAVGDMKAASENNVLYYPILVNHEKESWKKLNNEALDRFLKGEYAGTYQKELLNEFTENLSQG